MNKLEKLQLLKTLGVKFNHNCNMVAGDVGLLNGFFIAPSDSYYFIINGKMPLKDAEYIFNTYDNNKYKVRVDGGCEDWKPIDKCENDKFNDFLQKELETLTSKEYFNNCEKYCKMKKELKKKHPEDFYVNTYHIDTIEGLKIIIDYIKEHNIKTIW